MNHVTKKHRSLFRTTVAVLAITVLVNRCGIFVEYDGECWTESIPAIIGGTLLATEGTIHLAQLGPKKPQSLFALTDAVNPIPEAQAAAYCPTLDDFTGSQIRCITPTNIAPYFTVGGSVLEIRYESCKFRNRTDQTPGYWYMYHRLALPSSTICDNVVSSGNFTSVYASLVGETVTRTFGQNHPLQSAEQNNLRLAENVEISGIFSDFPSGWYDPSPQGGVEIAFGAGGTRTLKIKGIHQTGHTPLSTTKYADPGDGTEWNFLNERLDVRDLSAYELNKDYRIPFDHTIDSPADETFTTNEQDISAKTYSTISVTGTGASRTVTAMTNVRVQHNIANLKDPKTYSKSFLPDGQTLSWADDPACCWPTSGKIRTEFIKRNQLNPRPDWKAEEIEFTSTCGKVKYKGFFTKDSQDADYTVDHDLTQCI